MDLKHDRPRTPRTRTVIAAGVALAVASLLVIATASAAPPTKGPIPDEAWKPGAAELDMSLVPDFVPALGRDGDVAGYVRKEEALGDPPARAVGRPTRPDIPVYADDLSTLVGHMVAGKGFVALGVDPDSVPNIPVVQAPAP